VESLRPSLTLSPNLTPSSNRRTKSSKRRSRAKSAPREGWRREEEKEKLGKTKNNKAIDDKNEKSFDQAEEMLSMSGTRLQVRLTPKRGKSAATERNALF
jgi:hypothetical protein